MTDRITSPSNPRIKYVTRLRQSRFRRREGRFLVDSLREFKRALQSGFALESLYLNDDQKNASTHSGVHSLLAEWSGAPAEAPDPGQTSPTDPAFAGNTVCHVAPPVFRKISYGDWNEGLVAQFLAPDRPLDSLQITKPDPLVLVLDRLEKPGNVGAILRTADAAGVDAVVLSDYASDLFHPNVIRASSGAVFSLPIGIATATEANDWLNQRGVQVCTARVEATRPLWDLGWTGAVALVVGNEATGLGPRWQHTQFASFTIPMQGIADSLNASVTTAICLFEAVRQRRA